MRKVEVKSTGSVKKQYRKTCQVKIILKFSHKEDCFINNNFDFLFQHADRKKGLLLYY